MSADAGAGRSAPPTASASASGGAGAREALAAAQAGLVAALVAGAPVPAGFDVERVGVQARALLAKRRSVAAAHHPWLVEALGEEEYARRFAEYAAGRPKAFGSGGHADALAFEAHLRDANALPAPTRDRPRSRLRRLRRA